MRLKMLISCCVGLLMLFTFAPAVTHAAVPQQINYQGNLTDTGGNPLNGNYSMVFAIYDVSTGGSALWSELQMVSVANGIYNVQIGQDPMGNPFPDNLFDGQRWLGVTVGADAEMTPRQKLASVPFALMAGGALGVWKDNLTGDHVYPSGEEDTLDPDVWVCIGNQTPETLLHIYDNSADGSGGEDHKPQINIYQDGDGDAAQTYRLQFDGGNRHHFTLGIDKHFTAPNKPDSFDFKICHETYEEVGGAVPATLGYLKGEAYNAAEMMVRIHGTDWSGSGPDKKSSGIIDFNHQSRAKVYLSSPQVIVPMAWIGVEFDLSQYDEHGEVVLGSPGTPAVFTATETGYYQVNARVEFNIDAASITLPLVGNDAYVSIAIYHNQSYTYYAMGNNLQIYNVALNNIGGSEAGCFASNNAPNVSDVLFLQAGEIIEIHVYQSSGAPLPLTGGSMDKNYFSVHKLS